jgi:branched-chain amino acid transport system ATP-binding protein
LLGRWPGWPRAGTITLDGQPLRPGDAAQAVRAGLIMVAEGRHLFPQMTVIENLQLGGWLLTRRERAGRVERVLALFPRLAERRHQLTRTLSGGEQQMTIARALVGRPLLLTLDEPSLDWLGLIDEVSPSHACGGRNHHFWSSRTWPGL